MHINLTLLRHFEYAWAASTFGDFMRSTKASAAVERLKTRSGNALYSMASLSNGLFALHLIAASGKSDTVCVPLPMDEFIRFVNNLEVAKPKRLSKLDVVFREKLKASGLTPNDSKDK
jgi:hypothetical protein